MEYKPYTYLKEVHTVDGEIIDFDPSSARFLIENKSLKAKTWKSRMDFRLKEDPRDMIKIIEERERAHVLIEATRQCLQLQNLISTKFTELYPYI